MKSASIILGFMIFISSVCLPSSHSSIFLFFLSSFFFPLFLSSSSLFLLLVSFFLLFVYSSHFIFRYLFYSPYPFLFLLPILSFPSFYFFSFLGVLFSLVFHDPTLLSSSSQGHRDNPNITFVNCVPYPLSNQMHPKIHSVMIFLVYFLIPLAIISVYYYHIARTLIKSAHNMPGEVSEHTKRQVSDGWMNEWICRFSFQQ